jgi:hypothetical protein
VNRDDLPRLARELVDVAVEACGWHVDHPDDDTFVEGANASFTLSFLLPLSSGRSFVFTTNWARSARTGRWQSLKTEGGYRVVGALLPGDGSARDIMAEMLSTPLEVRYWTALSHIRGRLRKPADVAALDWVDDAPACLCEFKGAEGCLCELCVHGDCGTLLTEGEKEMAFPEGGDGGNEVWPLCGECVLHYYNADGEPICVETSQGATNA